MNKARAAIVAVALMALAVAVGGLWVVIAPSPTLQVLPGDEGVSFPQQEAEKLFSSVAVFAFLAMGLGAVIAFATWFGLRDTRGPAGLAFVVVMSIATSGLALDAGTRIARLTRGTLDADSPGPFHGTARLWMNSSVGPSWVLLVCAPAVGALIYLVCVLMSSDGELGRGPRPTASPAGSTPAVAYAPGGTTSESVTGEGEGPRTRP
ncbi:DUF2567 domain-containing protein [Gordonia shandongensis]|uniref:DUF2567 domain-containing protein n=1 Tax=Gordonia shandongensis TaxID=376351 RepID=UPI0004141F42|nr:DUF2567 domain-containing protein [Gordonia shandongensis]